MHRVFNDIISYGFDTRGTPFTGISYVFIPQEEQKADMVYDTIDPSIGEADFDSKECTQSEFGHLQG